MNARAPHTFVINSWQPHPDEMTRFLPDHRIKGRGLCVTSWTAINLNESSTNIDTGETRPRKPFSTSCLNFFFQSRKLSEEEKKI